MPRANAQKVTSPYIGVVFDRKIQKWKSGVMVDGKNYPCGFYEKDIDAVKARDLAIIRFNLPQKLLQVIKPK